MVWTNQTVSILSMRLLAATASQVRRLLATAWLVLGSESIRKFTNISLDNSQKTDIRAVLNYGHTPENSAPFDENSKSKKF